MSLRGPVNFDLSRRPLFLYLTPVQLYKLSEQWTLAADVGLSRAAEQGARSEKYGLLGAIYHANDDLDLDFGWRRSLGGSPTAHTLGVGVTVRW